MHTWVQQCNSATLQYRKYENRIQTDECIHCIYNTELYTYIKKQCDRRLRHEIAWFCIQLLEFHFVDVCLLNWIKYTIFFLFSLSLLRVLVGDCDSPFFFFLPHIDHIWMNRMEEIFIYHTKYNFCCWYQIKKKGIRILHLNLTDIGISNNNQHHSTNENRPQMIIRQKWHPYWCIPIVLFDKQTMQHMKFYSILAVLVLDA